MPKSFRVIVSILSFLIMAHVAEGQSFITTVQFDLDNEIIVIIGSNLGPNPTVFMGSEAGLLDQLNVINSSTHFVIADLKTTAPGTYVLLVIKGTSVGFSNVSIGPPGEQGPPGPPGPDNPNIITEDRKTALGIGALVNNTTGQSNTAVGDSALALNTAGLNNTALEDSALRSNTIGTQNTATGDNALVNNTAGINNTASGFNVMFFNTTGQSNTAVGASALAGNTTGSSNTANGTSALQNNTTGNNNTATGMIALLDNTTGVKNTALGYAALDLNTFGSNNTAVGFEAGFNATTGDNNIYINNPGQTGDSGVIAIGERGVQTRTFIAGISGVTTDLPKGSVVLVDTDGQLGTVLSSRRFKEDIRDMDQVSDGLIHLRPVTFRYKKTPANGERPLQYGLIAEEVAEVYPELVVYNTASETQSVQYHQLPVLLLNELQKQQRKIQEQEEQIQEQDKQIANLTDRLVRLERILTAQQTFAALTQ